jgi:prepilin-type processing-associated H-X9-DG protein
MRNGKRDGEADELSAASHSERSGRVASGLTIVELLVVLAVIGLLIGLLIPAVQSAREAARDLHCKNNLREFTFASKALGDAQNRLPESRVHFDTSGSGQIVREQTWGRSVAPFLIGNIANEWSAGPQTFESAYYALYENSPAMLHCPSSIPKQRLTRFSPMVGHPIDPAIVTESADYRGNLGFWDISFAHRGIGGSGPFAILKNSVSPIRENSITDGLSETVYCWETIGAGHVESFGETLHVKNRVRSNSPQDIYFENSDTDTYESPQGTSLHGHHSGWAGFMAGHIEVIWLASDSGRFIPRFFRRNTRGDPFSLHPGGINVSMCDGRIQRISRMIDWHVLYAIIQKNEHSSVITAE